MRYFKKIACSFARDYESVNEDFKNSLSRRVKRYVSFFNELRTFPFKSVR